MKNIFGTVIISLFMGVPGLADEVKPLLEGFGQIPNRAHSLAEMEEKSATARPPGALLVILRPGQKKVFLEPPIGGVEIRCEVKPNNTAFICSGDCSCSHNVISTTSPTRSVSGSTRTDAFNNLKDLCDKECKHGIPGVGIVVGKDFFGYKELVDATEANACVPN